MEIAVDGVGTKVERGWKDSDGFLGPLQPGVGPRRNPLGDFPTGPDVGEAFPDVVALAHDGRTIDVHEDRAGRPAVFVFFRSAVW